MLKLIIGLEIILVCNALAAASDVPTIVWWTQLLYPHLREDSRLPCDNSYCKVTKKIIPENTTDFVGFVFYGSDFNPEDLPLPKLPNHVWTLLHEESPMNNYIFSHSFGIQLFNYTGTFSRYSDFPLTLQHLPTLEYLTERPAMSTDAKNYLRNNGLAPIIYVQSHCNVASDRDRYVKELMKYIPVDSYGSCLHNKEFGNSLNSTSMYESVLFLDFISQYKFQLAFENAICEDYITEKLFRALHVGTVPVYRGSPFVQDWDPLVNSIIVVDDFKSPKELAVFLRRLDQDDKAYNKYLEFKDGIRNELLIKTMEEREWGVNDYQKMDFINAFECYVCDQLTQLNKMDRKLVKPKIANRSHMNCHQPRSSIDKSLISPDEWVKEDWPEIYWFGFDQAKAMMTMVERRENSSSTFFKYLIDMKYKI